MHAHWNGKFLALGGGGWSGSFSNAYGTGLQRGYATVSTDTGHKSGDPTEVSWQLIAPGVPANDRIEDCNWRAVEQLTIVGKAIVQAYYGKTIALSYWQGCSTGGRQGMVLAQRFPTTTESSLAPPFSPRSCR
jgi:feruloyl esterase